MLAVSEMLNVLSVSNRNGRFVIISLTHRVAKHPSVAYTLSYIYFCQTLDNFTRDKLLYSRLGGGGKYLGPAIVVLLEWHIKGQEKF